MTTKSTGRGGAGNIGPEESKSGGPPAASLETPTIKSDVYTTGRGGSGNMAANDPNRPEIARAAQDVTGPVDKSENRTGAVHHGRGGGGNVIKPEASHKAKEKAKAQEQSPNRGLEPIVGTQKKQRSASSGLLEKAKEGLDRVRSSGAKKETK